MMVLDVGPETVAAIEARPTLQDPGLERPARRLRDAALRCGDRRRGAGGGGADQCRRAGSRSRGGGDTVSALKHAGVAERLTYVSTAGGAFLEWLEGKTLPGVAALETA